MSPARATLIVSVCAALSRVLGFARDVLLTQFLGAGVAADAFLAAFRLPNALRRIASEGGFNPAFIPLYLKLKADHGDAAGTFARQACLVWGGLLVLATVVAEIAAEPVMLLLAGGLEPAAFALAVSYFRLLFPLVFGSGLAALLAAVLNAEKRVVATSFAPLVFNLTIVAVISASQLSHLDSARSGFWIAITCSVAGLFHLAIVALAMRDSALLHGGFAFSVSTLRASDSLRRFARSALPVLAAIGTVQLFPIAAAQVASHIPSAVSWFYYADRLFQLPTGFIAAASGVVLLPQVARHYARNNRRACIHAQNRALEGALLLSLPAAAALAYLALPITVALFQRGAFTADDSRQTAAMLLVLGFALPFAVTAKVFASAIFALGKIRAAIVAGLAGLITTYGATILCAGLFSAVGVAIGTGIGIVTYCCLLMLVLWQSGLWRPDLRLAARCGRIVIATAGMMVIVAALARFVDPSRPVGLVICCVCGVIVYAAAAWLSGAVSHRDIKRYLRH